MTYSKVPHKVRIGLSLQRPLPHDRIRKDLAIAQAYGLDPQPVYEECVREQQLLKGDPRQRFPQYNEVAPAEVADRETVIMMG